MTVHQPIDVELDRVMSDVRAVIEPRRPSVAAGRARPSWTRRLAAAWLLMVGAALGAGGTMLVRPPAQPVREAPPRGRGTIAAASAPAARAVVAQAPPPVVEVPPAPAAAQPRPQPQPRPRPRPSTRPATASPVGRPSPRAVADARPGARARPSVPRRAAGRAVAGAYRRAGRPAAVPARTPALVAPYRRAPERYATVRYDNRYDERPAASRDDRRLTRAVNRRELERVRDEIEAAEREARPRRKRRSLRDIFGL